MTPDAAALTAGERRVLALLASGHTAKSIAAELAISVHAVNERLREARRKTGAASSRELARALITLETRDKEIGVGERAPAPTGLAPAVAMQRQRFGARELVIMSIAVTALIAAIGLLPQQERPPASPYAVLTQPRADTADAYRRVRAEQRDVVWAEAAERRLDGLYAPVPGVGPVEVRCARTLCEVAAEVVESESTRALELMRRRDFTAAVRRSGFGGDLILIVGSKTGEPARFVAYWHRSGG